MDGVPHPLCRVADMGRIVGKLFFADHVVFAGSIQGAMGHPIGRLIPLTQFIRAFDRLSLRHDLSSTLAYANTSAGKVKSSATSRHSHVARFPPPKSNAWGFSTSPFALATPW